MGPSFRLQRFTADFRDLTSWVTEMKALINADELANDVAGAEALLDRHQEHKVQPLHSVQVLTSSPGPWRPTILKIMEVFAPTHLVKKN